MLADLKSSDLATAGMLQPKAPYSSQLQKPELEMLPVEMQGVDYYFQEANPIASSWSITTSPNITRSRVASNI